MKTIIKTTLASLALLGGMASCSDYLEQESPSSVTGKVIFSSEELAENAIANIYVEFGEQNYRARSIWYGYNTDVEFYLNSDKSDGKADLATYAARINNDQMNVTTGTDLWAKIYAAIERANLVIANLPESGDTTNVNIRHMYGEALTLRALHYLDLINMWGDVPARFEPTNADNIYIPRSDRDVIYKQIIADLQTAEKYCAWPQEIPATMTVERVNLAFVKGLLARVCLQASGYAQRMDGENRLSTDPELSKAKLYPIALKACEDVINNKKAADLKKYFEDVFNNKGICGDVIKAGEESLFEIGYSNNPARGRIAYTFGLKHNSSDNMAGITQGSQVGPMPTLYWDYAEGDQRRDVTCCPFQWNKGKQELKGLAAWSFGKLRYEWMERMVANGANDDGINKCYMRFADVCLMAAEAANELNDLEAAKKYFKKVRERAFTDAAGEKVSQYGEQVTNYLTNITNKDQMFKAIVKERGLEFAGELVRKADLIRWGLLKTCMDEAKAKMYALRNLGKYENAESYSGSVDYSRMNGRVFYRLVDFTWTRGGVNKTESKAKLEIRGLKLDGSDKADTTPSGFSEYTDSNGKVTSWIKEGALKDEVIESLYTNDPDKRQYWPIFNVNLNDNASLVNYDWYK